MATGDLAEGSAADKRTALQAKIADARTRADAGDDGAGDELATLYRNLLSTTRDAYGTAGGEYSADRATVSSGAAAVIKAEQDRINQAAGVQAKIADSTARAAEIADESADLLAKLVTSNAAIAAALASDNGTSSIVPNFALTKIDWAA